MSLRYLLNINFLYLIFFCFLLSNVCVYSFDLMFGVNYSKIFYFYILMIGGSIIAIVEFFSQKIVSFKINWGDISISCFVLICVMKSSNNSEYTELLGLLLLYFIVKNQQSSNRFSLIVIFITIVSFKNIALMQANAAELVYDQENNEECTITLSNGTPITSKGYLRAFDKID